MITHFTYPRKLKCPFQSTPKRGKTTLCFGDSSDFFFPVLKWSPRQHLVNAHQLPIPNLILPELYITCQIVFKKIILIIPASGLVQSFVQELIKTVSNIMSLLWATIKLLRTKICCSVNKCLLIRFGTREQQIYYTIKTCCKFLYQKLNSEIIKLHDIKQGTVYSFCHTYIQVPVSVNRI